MKLKLLILFTCIISFTNTHAQNVHKTKNVVVILIDGYRWQELFQGADFELLNSKKYNGNDSSERFKGYWSENVEARRKKLMPFTWNYIATHGQLYGNRKLGNKVNVMNPYWISYPGRAEVLSGFVDSAINSNSYGDNQNQNVLEFLNKQKGFTNQVVTFACWDATGRCLNKNKSKMLINVPWEDIKTDHLTQPEILANEMQHYLPKVFGDEERLDAEVYALAKSYIIANHPKVTYIDFGDTDEYAHEGKYESYLLDIQNLDGMIEKLLKMMQNDPFYKNNTTFLIVPDHGRGTGNEWTDHGSSTPHSNETWFMVIGPDTEPLGEMKTNEQIYQTQFAKTIVTLLGFNYDVAGNKAGGIIESVIDK